LSSTTAHAGDFKHQSYQGATYRPCSAQQLTVEYGQGASENLCEFWTELKPTFWKSLIFNEQNIVKLSVRNEIFTHAEW
jgi:hypothetical protein